MPRRAPPREYYDADPYEVERDRDRRSQRSKRYRTIDDDNDPYRRRSSMPPPVADLERLRIRDRLPPEYVRESYAPSRGSGPLPFRRGRGRDDMAAPPPPPAPPAPPSPPPEKSRDDFPVRRKKGNRRRKELDISDSGEDDVSMLRRSERPPPPPPALDDHDSDDALVRRERRRRKGRMAVDSIPPPPPPPLDDQDSDEEMLRRERRRRKGRVPKESIPPPPPPPALPADDHDSDDALVRRDRRRRKGRVPVDPMPPPPPLPADDQDSDEEIVHREQRRRKGRVPVESEYKRSETQPRYLHKPNMGRHRGKEQENVRIPKDSRIRSWSRRRNDGDSETSDSDDDDDDEEDSDDDDEDEDDDDEDDEDDDEDDEFVIPRKSERGRKYRRGDPEEELIIRNRVDDSSPGSPSLRDPSPDPVPSRSRRRPKFIEPDYEMINAPPAPEFPAHEPGGRNRKEKKNKKKEKQVQGGALERSQGVISPEQHYPSPKASRRRKKEEAQAAQAAQSRPPPPPLDHGKDLSIRGHNRQIKDAHDKREDMDLDLYSHRKPEPPFADGVPKGMAGDVSFIDPTPMPVPAMRGSVSDQIVFGLNEGDQRIRYFPEDDDSSEEEMDDGKVGRRYIGMKEQRKRLWTEITKDLVVREAIERAGYEYEETDSFYYIFSYLHYDDVSSLVELSEDIRRARRRRIHEINHERASSYLPPQSPQQVPPAPPQAPPAPIPPAAAAPPAFDKFAPPPPMMHHHPHHQPPPPWAWEARPGHGGGHPAGPRFVPGPGPGPGHGHGPIPVPVPSPWEAHRMKQRELAFEESRWRQPPRPRW